MFARTIGFASRNAVAMLALFVALSGTAVAGGPLVTGAQIAAETITGYNVKDGSLGTSDVADNSLTGADIVESSLETVNSAWTAQSASKATTATSADNAQKLGGKSSTSYLGVADSMKRYSQQYFTTAGASPSRSDAKCVYWDRGGMYPGSLVLGFVSPSGLYTAAPAVVKSNGAVTLMACQIGVVPSGQAYLVPDVNWFVFNG